jgi:hypothetical protein
LELPKGFDDAPEDKTNWSDLMGKQGTNNKNNPAPKSEPVNKNPNKSNNSNSTKRSTKNSNNTNTITVKEKVKYTETKTQRAYWIDNNLVEVFDKEYPTKKYDKSDIMNQLLRNFLIENSKI